MGIAYNPATQSWSVVPEKTDYRTDYKTDYETTRKTDYVTNLPTNTPLPSFLPTNLRYDYPTTLRTDFKTDFNERTEYTNKVGVYRTSSKGGPKTTYTFGQGYKTISFVPVKEDKFEYRYVSGSGRFGTTYATATIDGVKATLAKALVGAGFPPDKAVEYALANVQGVRDVRDENDRNVALNAENRQKNADNARQNQENAALNDKNFRTNMENADKNIQIEQDRFNIQTQNEQNRITNETNLGLNNTNYRLNQEGLKLNEQNTKLNTDNTYFNLSGNLSNNLYNKTLQIASNTQGGDYTQQRDRIAVEELVNSGMRYEDATELVDNIRSQFKDFYRTEKLTTWDSNLGAQPPYGIFDPKYYGEQNPVLAQAYAEAVANDDIDITERYGENNYYLQHYTSTGKAQGLRGNKEEDTVAVNAYVEQTPTDSDIQMIRDKQLGVNQGTITERLLNIPEVANEWTKAKMGDPYWSALAKEKYLDPTIADEFSVLFRLSERPEDKQIIFQSTLGVEEGITQLEDAINEAIAKKTEFDIKNFAALSQNVLKDTIAEMKRVKGEQEMLTFYRGFSGFSEVVDINKELSNAILGDTGVGGILSYTSAGKAEESLLNSLQNVTGMRNSIVYNWQQWFDKAIKDKYGIDYAQFEPLEEKKDILNAFLESEKKPFDQAKGTFTDEFVASAGFSSSNSLVEFLEGQGEEGLSILEAIKGDVNEETKQILYPIQSRILADINVLDAAKDRDLALSMTLGDKTEMMNIEAQFARDYIDEYLLPRFNTSRSMDEFVEYLDVRQEERNPFQTSALYLQDTYQAMKALSDKYTEEYLGNIKLEGPRSFDPNFYFDPSGDKGRVSSYAKQKEMVEKDWEEAKRQVAEGSGYWYQQAYRFGVDVNNKAAFARMHFEVKGQGQGFDAADDIVNAGKVEDFLYSTVVPVLQEKAFEAPVAAFGQFITPEEFADEMLRGLDPYNTPDEWKEVLQRYGLTDFAGTVEELKEYIVETLRTGSALDIREQIKYLNEKRQRPTQEILGVTYIERPEDYKDEMAKPTTELYAIYQKAGYQGTEDEFYENFFPDLDRSEQVLLTKAGRDDPLKTYGLDLSDPFASLGTIESFFPEDQQAALKEAQKDSDKDPYTSYFRLGEDDEEIDYKSNAGKQFLGEFTSMFKGL
jgi:hypothetical protein